MHLYSPTATTWPRQARFVIGALINVGGLGIAVGHLLGR